AGEPGWWGAGDDDPAVGDVRVEGPEGVPEFLVVLTRPAGVDDVHAPAPACAGPHIAAPGRARRTRARSRRSGSGRSVLAYCRCPASAVPAACASLWACRRLQRGPRRGRDEFGPGRQLCPGGARWRSEEHTSELQSRENL